MCNNRGRKEKNKTIFAAQKLGRNINVGPKAQERDAAVGAMPFLLHRSLTQKPIHLAL